MKLIGKLFSSIGPVVIFVFVMILLFGVGIGVKNIFGETQYMQFGDFMDIKDAANDIPGMEEMFAPLVNIANYMIVMLSFSIIAVLAFIPLWVVSFSKLLTLVVSIAVVFASFIIGVMGICVLVEADGANGLTLAMWSIFGIILPLGSSIASGAFGFLGFKKD